MKLRMISLTTGLLLAATAFAQNGPTILVPEKPQPAGPRYVSVAPARENPQHFIARARDLLPLLREHPADDGTRFHDFQIEGVHLWPSSVFTRESLRLLDEEGGKFDRKLRDRLLDCAARPAPSSAQVLLINAQTGRLPRVPVFLDPDAKELAYLELSVEQPGEPVLLQVASYDGIALRLTVSKRTRLAGVRLASYYPGVVLGVDPALVSQRTQHRSTAQPCALEAFRSSAVQDPAFDVTNTVTYKTDGTNYQMAIGQPQATRRARPTLGNFLDPDMPVSNQHGLVVLAARGYIASIPQIVDGRSYGLHTYQILKPFRFPEGLAGSHAVTFLLPDGVEPPSGGLGHSSLLRRVD